MSVKPSSPAAAGRVDVDAGESDDSMLPPTPGLGVVMLALCSGVVVALMTTVATVAAASAVSLVLPHTGDRVGAVAYFVLSGVVLLLAARSWWRAFIDRSAGAVRWAALVLPFFVVVGAAGGLAFAKSVLPPREAAQWRDDKACEAALHQFNTEHPAFVLCARAARQCQLRVLDDSNTWEDFESCVVDAVADLHLLGPEAR